MIGDVNDRVIHYKLNLISQDISSSSGFSYVSVELDDSISEVFLATPR
jgi:hypothetical protein